MSDSLVLVLDKPIPKKFTESETKVSHLDSSYHIYIADEIADVLRHANPRGLGYNVEGYAYNIWRTNGAAFYWESGLKWDSENEVLVEVKNFGQPEDEKEYKWIYGNMIELLELGFSVKLFNGNIHISSYEEFIAKKTLNVEQLKDITTTLEYNVLYTITKQNIRGGNYE